MIDPDDPLAQPLTLEQAASVARVSKRTVQYWISSGALKAYEIPIGKRSRDTPRRYVEEREVLEVERVYWKRRQVR